MAGDATFLYNTNLANYNGIAPGKLAVDAGTLITLAQADLSGAQLDLLLRTGRDVVITSTIQTEATVKDVPDAKTIDAWIIRNANNPHLIIDNSPLNPAYVPQSDNGERSIIGYVQRTDGDIRVVSEDLKWMDGLRPGLAAGRDLAGTSGVNLTTNEFVNDLMLSGSISPYEHSLAALQILKADRNNVDQQNILFRPGDDIPIADQNGNTGHVFYGGPLGAIAVDEHGIPIGVPAIFGLRLSIPKSSPLKVTEADHTDDTAALAYGPVENANGKLIVVGDDTDHSSLLQQARFEYDPDAGTMTRSLVKDDGTSAKTVFDTGTQPWSSETSASDAYQHLQSQRVVFDDGSQQVKQYDPNNTHPYKEVDRTEGPDGKVTAAQVTLDPNVLATGMSIGQVLGSALGNALGGNDQLTKLVGGAVGGLIGQKFVQVLATSMTMDLSKVSLNDVFAGQGISIANAGIGVVSSFLTAELGHALHIDGFDGQLFNTAVSGFTTSLLTQVTGKMATSGLTFEAAIATMDWSQAVSGAISTAELDIGNLLGGYLGHELVPAKTHTGAVGGELLGAIGSIILPGGLGSLIGTILGTLIGDALGHPPHPAAVDLIDQAGYYYSYNHSSISASDGGGYEVPDPMANATVAIVNEYLHAVNGAALDHSKQTMVGYVTDPQLYYVSGWVPSGAYHTNLTPDDAVHAAALDLLQHTEVIGGDLLMKRAHQNSPSNIPETQAGSGAPGQSQVSSAEQLVTMSGDLSVAQDYENYLNNREAINALIAANPDSAFAAGWIATFARVNDLGLNHMGASDFLGGLVGYLDSVNKAGLGAEAANATVSRGAGNTVLVDVKVANGAEVPGSLSVFADSMTTTSDASGQTLRFIVDSGIAASGEHFLSAGASGGDGGNDLWIGNAGAANTFNGTGGHDILVGGAGNDIIHGGAGFDFIDGGAGNDTLVGEDGNDILRGGTGNDNLQGGAGNDTYVFNRGDGADIVLDDYRPLTWVPGSGSIGGALTGSYQNVQADAGTDSLVFGPGIAQSDIALVQASNGDLIITIKDPAHPGAAPTDSITLQHWFDANGFDRVEKFAFADGTTLDLSSGVLAPYLVPFGETLSGQSVLEKSAVGTVVGTVTGFDFNPNATLSYSLVNSDGRFAINASTGVLTVAGAINYDAANSPHITVRASDGTHSFDQAFTINVIDIPNRAPVLSVPASNITANPGQSLQVSSWFGASDADNDALTYNFQDGTTAANSGHFVLNGTALAQGATFALTAAQLATLTFVAGAAGVADDLSMQLSDGSAASALGAFHVSVNHGPTDATLSGGGVAENSPAGTHVATVTGVDPDAGASLHYSLLNPDGHFAINASSGEVTVAAGALLDYEAATSWQISVRTADQSGLFFDKSFAINVTNVNEAPTDSTLFGGTVREHSANGTHVGTVIGADPDAGDVLHYALATDAGGRFAINAATGVITVKDGTLPRSTAHGSHPDRNRRVTARRVARAGGWRRARRASATAIITCIHKRSA
jgi:hypothetical protein